MAISKNFLKRTEERHQWIASSSAAVVLFASLTSVHAQPYFTRITEGAVVNDPLIRFSIDWIDYDSDGDLDLFHASLLSEHVLHENYGDGSFKSVPVFPFTEFSGELLSAWGDYDNDSDPDLYIGSGQNNQFYQNEGDGSFTLRTSSAIATPNGFTRACNWGDYDNDGYLDMFVGNSDGNNALYRNNGNGTFFQVTNGAFVNDAAMTRCLSLADYDNDGDLDVFVCNDSVDEAPGENNFLYENRGNGFFNRVRDEAIVTDGGKSRGSHWGDYDNDGDLDLLVNNGRGDIREIRFLYQNHGNGFLPITDGPLVNDLIGGDGGGWGDYDNDGDLDLVLAGPVLYENKGGGSFIRVTSGVVIVDNTENQFPGPIWGDYDNDGDLDLFAGKAEGGGVLYRNEATDSTANNWINITCIGTLSNRSAIGAKVRVFAVIDGKRVQQLREISGQGGHSQRAHFGLGDATVIDTIRVDWPLGQVQLLTDVSVDTFLSITEILPPQFGQPTIPATVEAASQVTVEVSVIATDLAETRLLFRQGGDNAFTRIPMSDLGNGSFRGIIPASAVTSKGVEYSFEATDVAGNTGRLPREGSFSIRVNVPAGISRGEEERFGTDQTAYHIFSVPLDLQDRSPAAILEDDMGEYDASRWRFLEYGTEEKTYREFPEIEQLQPGKGYWFLVTEPARVIDTPAGTSFTTAEPRSVLVRNGWNLIGNPLNFAIPATNVTQNGIVVELRSFNGSWNNPISDPVREIRPFEGYALSFDDFAGEIFIDPNVPVAGLSKESPNSNPKASPPRTARVSTESARRDAVALVESILWSINVQAQCQQARDVDNVLGVAAQAFESWDPLDYPEPPPIGEYVSVYFAHPAWGKRSQRFCTDFRPPVGATVPAARSLRGAPATKQSPGHEQKTRGLLRPAKRRTRNDAGVVRRPPEDFTGYVWEFEVQTNIRDRVELTFVGIETVPQEFDVWLLDETLALTRNLRSNQHFSVAGVGEKHPKRLKLLVGRSDFIDEQVPAQEVPTDFELSQNFPNPFNPVTSIRYGLPHEERVTLKIFNILGEEVATLLNEESLGAGFHVAIWDGRDQRGRQVASGVYLYQLMVGDLRETLKMALVR